MKPAPASLIEQLAIAPATGAAALVERPRGPVQDEYQFCDQLDRIAAELIEGRSTHSIAPDGSLTIRRKPGGIHVDHRANVHRTRI